MKSYVHALIVSAFTLSACDLLESSTAPSPSVDEPPPVETEEPSTDPAITETTAPLQITGDAELTITALDAVGSVGIDGTRRLVWDEDGVMLDDLIEGFEVLGTFSTIDGTWAGDDWAGNDLLLALDGGLSVWDGTLLQRSPLEDVLPMPVERIEHGRFAVWLWGAGRLVRWRDGQLTEIVTEDTIRDFAISPDGTLWLSTPALVGVNGLDDALPLVEANTDIAVQALTVDQEGTLWVVQDGALSARRPTGTWAHFTSESTIESVAATPWAGDVWVRTDAGAVHHRDGTFSNAALPDGTWMDVDEVGRLHIQSPTGAVVAAVGRPIAFRGLRPNAPVTVRTTVHLVPAGTPDELTAWINDTPVALDPDVWTLEVTPDALGDGEQTLRVVHTEGDRSYFSTLPFQIGELPETVWEDDLEILAAQCGECHNGSTSTRLDNREAWRAWIDVIIEQVSIGRMPPGGPPLSEEEIARIRGWKQRGFQ